MALLLVIASLSGASYAAAQQSAAPLRTAVVQIETATLRIEPSFLANSIGRVGYGTRIEVIEERAFALGNSGDWAAARAQYAMFTHDPCAQACITTIDERALSPEGLNGWDGTWEMRAK